MRTTDVSTSQHRGAKTAIIVLLAVVVALGGTVVGTALFLQEKLDAGIQRFGDPFDDLAVRPVGHASSGSSAPVNFLVLDSDLRGLAGDRAQREQRTGHTDTVMIAQLSADRDSANLLALPRDSWVEIPGHGPARLDAAYSLGGPTLAVATVENLTEIRIDHVVIADIDALTDTVADAVHEGRVRGPVSLGSFLESVGSALAVDDDVTVDRLRNLAFAAHDLRAENLAVVTAPSFGTGRSPDGTQSIVRLDHDALAELAAAFATGTFARHLAENPGAVTTLRSGA